MVAEVTEVTPALHRVRCMRKPPIPLLIAAAVLAIVTVGTVLQWRPGNRGAQNSFPSGAPAPQAFDAADPAPSGSTRLCNGTGLAPQGLAPPAHFVTLSWNAAVPASKSPLDAIRGYYVYRSSASRNYTERERMNPLPLRAVRCVDTSVEPRKTYFYVVKAVSAGGKQSRASAEIKVTIPAP
jgi:hypothetical protein